MNGILPAHKPGQEAKHSGCFLQGNRRRMAAVGGGKVACRDEYKAHVYQSEYGYEDQIGGQ